MIILYIAIFLFLGYSCLIIYYWLSWRSIPEYSSAAERPDTGFSVVIPARNEEKNIIGCLESVCSQHYPSELFQVIAIDDYSTDKTWDLLLHFHPGGKVINSTRWPKWKTVNFQRIKKER